MDLHTTRRENVQRLIDERYNGIVAEACRAWGKKASYLYAILTPGPHLKSIGEKVAREIEEYAGLQEGTLDKRRIELKPPVTAVRPVELPVPRDTMDAHAVPLFAQDSLLTLRKGRTPAITERKSFVYASRPHEDAVGLAVPDKAMETEFLVDEIVIIDLGVVPGPGDIVFARVDDQLIIRRYQPDGLAKQPTFMLKPTNEGFAPIWSDRVHIELLGVVSEHQRDMGRRRLN